MERDAYADMFQYRLGAEVHYAEYPGKKHYVCQRRWTQRAILDPVVDYRVSTSSTLDYPGQWVSERDLAPWQEPPQNLS